MVQGSGFRMRLLMFRLMFRGSPFAAGRIIFRAGQSDSGALHHMHYRYLYR